MEKELSELRKEILESRNLVIKTDNLLKNLQADIKQLSRRQEDIAKRNWIGSALAYAVFTALAVGGAALYTNARLATTHDEAASADRQIHELQVSLSTLQQDQTARKSASDMAARAYAQVSEGDPGARLKAAAALGSIDRSKLSALESRSLDDRARQLHDELASTALESGRAEFHRNDMKQAAADLERYLQMAPDGPDAIQANYMLGTALHESKDFAGSIEPLARFVQNGKGQKNLDYAMYLLGHSYESTGDHAKAVEMLRRGILEHPASEFIPQMRLVLSRATHAQADGAAAPPPLKTAAPPADAKH
jgi:TolA-binding protein